MFVYIKFVKKKLSIYQIINNYIISLFHLNSNIKKQLSMKLT